MSYYRTTRHKNRVKNLHNKHTACYKNRFEKKLQIYINTHKPVEQEGILFAERTRSRIRSVHVLLLQYTSLIKKNSDAFS